MSSQTENVVILGSGPAGLTAALYTARANLSPIVFHGIQPGGQLTTTTHVENFPGFPGGILGPELMERMQQQVEHFGARIVASSVHKIDLSSSPFTIEHEKGSVQTQTLIIATGASAKWLDLPEEKELRGFGLSTCATCDGAFFKNREIVVVGGGDSACEEALFLTRFGTRVRMIVRRDVFRASKIMSDRVLSHPKIEVLWNSQMVGLLGTRASGVTGARIKNLLTGETSEIACEGIFYAIGHTPNTGLFKGALEMDENGYLITHPGSTRTNVPGVFACGDVQDHVYRQAITAAGSGCMAAIDAERFLAGH
jgi:thioredoxin reductase (NADPH)